MKSSNQIKLKTIHKSDYSFLYELLSERTDLVNINHKKLPTYNEHLAFIKKKPYQKWYVIIDKNNVRLGTIYLTKKDEIGIFIKKKYIKKGLGTTALQLLIKKIPKSSYFANINPKNKQSINFFKKNGFLPIRLTFELKLK